MAPRSRWRAAGPAWTVRIRGKWYRFFDTHVEAFNPLIRLGQVRELVVLMSASPFPVVLAGDLNLYPQGTRSEDQPAWNLLLGAGFVDAWPEFGWRNARLHGRSDR